MVKRNLYSYVKKWGTKWGYFISHFHTYCPPLIIIIVIWSNGKQLSNVEDGRRKGYSKKEPLSQPFLMRSLKRRCWKMNLWTSAYRACCVIPLNCTSSQLTTTHDVMLIRAELNFGMQTCLLKLQGFAFLKSWNVHQIYSKLCLLAVPFCSSQQMLWQISC